MGFHHSRIGGMVFVTFIIAGKDLAGILKAVPVEFSLVLPLVLISIPDELYVIRVGFKLGMQRNDREGPREREYTEPYKWCFQIFQLLRKDGPQAVEKHIENPEKVWEFLYLAYPSFIKIIMLFTYVIRWTNDIQIYHPWCGWFDRRRRKKLFMPKNIWHLACDTSSADALPGLGIACRGFRAHGDHGALWTWGVGKIGSLCFNPGTLLETLHRVFRPHGLTLVQQSDVQK